MSGVLLLAACGVTRGVGSAVKPPGHGRPPPPSSITATLKREVRRLPRDRISWTTYWRLCWESYPGARAYELQALTGEGRSPALRRQRGRCLQLEVAANENRRSEGYRDERVQMGLSSGQLAYRVRAVLADNQATSWSPPYATGETVHSATGR